MTSPYTATSRISESDWARILDRSRELLDISLRTGACRSHLFAESTLRRRRTIRQGASVKSVGRPYFSEHTHWLEGGSICVDGEISRGFAASADVGNAALSTIAQRAAVSLGRTGSRPDATKRSAPLRFPSFVPLVGPLTTMVPADATETLRQLADACLSLNHHVRSVRVLLDERITRRLVVTSDGFAGTSRKVLTDVVVECRLHSGHVGRAVAGARAEDWTDLVDGNLSREAVEVAVAGKTGQELGPVRMPVILDAGWCAGVFLHELVGHQLEADNQQRGWSRLEQVSGLVCPRHVHVTDAPGRKGGRGSMAFDDEGCPSVLTRLISDGEVVGCLHDTVSARRATTTTNGHGRRQDYRFSPMPRMTNLVAGVAEKMNVDLPSGDALRVRSLGGGRVDGETGRFTFDVLRADRLHRREPMMPISGVTVTGFVSAALRAMVLFGSAEGDRGRGVCVKAGQAVPIGVMAPSILVEELEIVPKLHMPAVHSS